MCSGGYAHVQSWSMVDMLMCRADQWWICSCVELVNGGYAHVLINDGFSFVEW